MITLKHIAREYELDPYLYRQKLRQKMKHAKNQRWKWSEDDPALAQAQQIAKEMNDAKKPKPKQSDTKTS